MKYPNAPEGVFLSRPNRFIAEVLINDRVERVHVKNTGRCKELLVPGNTVYLCHQPNKARKTAYDLIAVKRSDGKMVNIDSYAPNIMAGKWINSGGLGIVENLRAEQKFGNSRFDYACDSNGRKTLIEVKGCTLERGGIAFFPDAPTERGCKHVRELTRYAQEGYRCVIMIVIQLDGVHLFKPNSATDPDFANALFEAQSAGVEIYALTCNVSPGYVAIAGSVPIDLDQ